MVIFNVAEYDFTFYVNGLAGDSWKLIGNNEAFDHVNGVEGEYNKIEGGDQAFNLPAEAIRVWVRE